MKAIVNKYNKHNKIYATIEQEYTTDAELEAFLATLNLPLNQFELFDVSAQAIIYNIYDQQQKLVYNDATGLFDAVDEPAQMSLWELSKHMDGTSVPTPTKDLICPHQWARYDGFNESYWYCKTCNLKADLDTLP